MSPTWMLIIVLLVLLMAGTPYTGLHPYGFWPSGLIGIVLLIVVILLLTGRL